MYCIYIYILLYTLFLFIKPNITAMLTNDTWSSVYAGAEQVTDISILTYSVLPYYAKPLGREEEEEERKEEDEEEALLAQENRKRTS